MVKVVEDIMYAINNPKESITSLETISSLRAPWQMQTEPASRSMWPHNYQLRDRGNEMTTLAHPSSPVLATRQDGQPEADINVG
jgi:hypothetical protein